MALRSWEVPRSDVQIRQAGMSLPNLGQSNGKVGLVEIAATQAGITVFNLGENRLSTMSSED